jgi:cyclin D1/2/4
LAAAATLPHDTVVSAAAAGIAAAEGFLAEFPLQSDDYVAALVERETEHMPVDGYLQKLHRRHGGQDLAAVRWDAVDWIWKVSSVNRWDPFFALLVRCRDVTRGFAQRCLLYRVHRGS